jgi:hypothetical protein
MAAVHEAYSFLNKTLKLGLSDGVLSSVEKMLKEEWLRGKGYGVPKSKVNDWEFIAFLEPRGSTNSKKRGGKAPIGRKKTK